MMVDERKELTDLVDEALKPHYTLETRHANGLVKSIGLAAGMVATTPISLVALLPAALTYPLYKFFEPPNPDDLDVDVYPTLSNMPFLVSSYIAMLPLAFCGELFFKGKKDFLKFPDVQAEDVFPKVYCITDREDSQCPFDIAFEQGIVKIYLPRNTILSPLYNTSYHEEMKGSPKIVYDIRPKRHEYPSSFFLGHIPIDEKKLQEIESLLKVYPHKKYSRGMHDC